MLTHVALAFAIGFLLAKGDAVKSPSAQVVLAVAAGFVLADLLKHKRRDWFDRFPSPLVTPGPDAPHVLIGAQGRDYIPYRPRATAPPGPAVPAEDDPLEYALATVPPASPAPSAAPSVPRPANATLPTKAALPAKTATQPPRTAGPLLYPMAETDELDL